MIYLFESELVENKSVLTSLTQIYGIGRVRSSFLCRNLGFSINFKVKDLSKIQVNQLIKFIESSNIVIAGDLKKTKLLVSKSLISIKSYRGLRRYQGLPVRGQRTHTNAKTAKKRK